MRHFELAAALLALSCPARRPDGDPGCRRQEAAGRAALHAEPRRAVDGPDAPTRASTSTSTLRRLDDEEPDPARPGALERLRQARRREPAVPLGPARGGRPKPRPAATPSEQKIGDYFAACMDEAAHREARARRRSRPSSTEIDALDVDGASWPRYLGAPAPARLRRAGSLFGFGSDQDFADATQVIAFADAGGLGPARPRLLREDRREVGGDPREVRARTSRGCCELLGEPPAAAAARRDAR